MYSIFVQKSAEMMMALLSLLAGAPLVASSAWVQDRFAISFWVR
jgi:hypothetical protein